jgi:hypothetical protein
MPSAPVVERTRASMRRTTASQCTNLLGSTSVAILSGSMSLSAYAPSAIETATAEIWPTATPIDPWSRGASAPPATVSVDTNSIQSRHVDFRVKAKHVHANATAMSLSRPTGVSAPARNAPKRTRRFSRLSTLGAAVASIVKKWEATRMLIFGDGASRRRVTPFSAGIAMQALDLQGSARTWNNG